MGTKKAVFRSFPTNIGSCGQGKRLYKGNLSQDQRIRTSAREASGNGRCWWIYKFLINNPMYGTKS